MARHTDQRCRVAANRQAQQRMRRPQDLIGAVIFGGLAASLDWVSKKQRDATKTEAKPELAAAISSPLPKYVGKLVKETESETVLLATKSGIQTRSIEIGDSGAILAFQGENDNIFNQLNGLRDVFLQIGILDGHLVISTQIKNADGKLVAEIVRNEWKVAPPPGTWDRNYSDNALEVINDEGRVVLQVRLLSDRIQLQSEWWIEKDYGFRFVSEGNKAGGTIQFMMPGKKIDFIPIRRMFSYPSETHLGEFSSDYQGAGK